MAKYRVTADADGMEHFGAIVDKNQIGETVQAIFNLYEIFINSYEIKINRVQEQMYNLETDDPRVE